MSYKINQKISLINFSDANRAKENIKYIVIHWVGAISTAERNINYFYNRYIGASAHYFCDKTSIWQSILEEDIAWHVGANSYKHFNCRNSNSIGIEMCLEKGMTIGEDTLKRTIWLVQKLMKKYEIKSENVLRHFDVTGKKCPGPFIDDKKWNDLKHRIINDNKIYSTSVPDWGIAAFEKLQTKGVIKTPEYWEGKLAQKDLAVYEIMALLANMIE